MKIHKFFLIILLSINSSILSYKEITMKAFNNITFLKSIAKEHLSRRISEDNNSEFYIIIIFFFKAGSNLGSEKWKYYLIDKPNDLEEIIKDNAILYKNSYDSHLHWKSYCREKPYSCCSIM